MLPVKLAVANDLFDRRRYEITNGTPGGNPVSDIRRGNIQMPLESSDKGVRFSRRCDRARRTAPFSKVRRNDATSAGGQRCLRRSNRKIRRSARETGALPRFDRIGRRRAPQFHSSSRKSRFTFNRSAQHFQADIGAARASLEFVRRSGGRDKITLSSSKCFDRLTRQDQMPVMDRIECSAEDANSFSKCSF